MSTPDGDLEKAMRKLDLSAVEKRGIKIGKMKGLMEEEDHWQVVGKVMSDRSISVESIHQTLGKIWCGDKGMVIKDVGDNKFIFSFNHPMGKKRALEDGPWTANHSLMVLVAFDARKDLEAVEFTHVPIWIRVSKIPMGMMNREVAEIIGNEIGCFMDVDVEENGTAVGRFLRVKVKIDIRVPLMRGVTIELDEEDGESRWCPVEYEFLPDFCYCCGVIGHMDWQCPKPVPVKERQYGRWLRVVPPRRRFSEDVGGKRPGERGVGRSSGDWRRDKEERNLMISNVTSKQIGKEGKEGMLKRGQGRGQGNPQKGDGQADKKEDLVAKIAMEGGGQMDTGDDKMKLAVHDTVQPAGQSGHDTIQPAGQIPPRVGDADGKKGARKTGTFKRVQRERRNDGSGVEGESGKRRASDMDIDDMMRNSKRSKGEVAQDGGEGDAEMEMAGAQGAVQELVSNSMAGLSEQLRGAQ